MATRGRDCFCFWFFWGFFYPPDCLDLFSKVLDWWKVLAHLFCVLSVTDRDGIKEWCQWWSTWAAQPGADRTATRPRTEWQGQKTFLAGGKSIKNAVPVVKRREGSRHSLPRRVMFFDAVSYEPLPLHVNVAWKSFADTLSMVRTAVEKTSLEIFFMTLTKMEKQLPLNTTLMIIPCNSTPPFS